ncbi:RAC-gamma serine/threonine-protein kinase [Chytriomyces hyalinus]|nr:RAC-gamma serine/threonine-protein kinase [Chytriomyces hyalinus]
MDEDASPHLSPKEHISDAHELRNSVSQVLGPVTVTHTPFFEEPDNYEDNSSALHAFLDNDAGGKPMGFEHDDETWERFRKIKLSNSPTKTPPASNTPRVLRSASSHRQNGNLSANIGGPRKTALSDGLQSSPTTQSFATIPGAGNESYFLKKIRGGAGTKEIDWLPLNSIWSSKKALSREEIQVTLFATADILAGANTLTSFSALKKQQATQDDSSNFKSMVLNDSTSPLRVFEIADRIASGGIVDPETDFPIVAWFLKLVAACPNMCNDDVPVDTNGVLSRQPSGVDVRNDGESLSSRTVLTNEETKATIEKDNILATMAAKSEADSNNTNDAVKGDINVTIVTEEPKADPSEGTLMPTDSDNGITVTKVFPGDEKRCVTYKIHMKDDFGNSFIIPAHAGITVNEIKCEALRLLGIVEFIDRHDIFGVDYKQEDVPLDYLNMPIGFSSRPGRRRDSNVSTMRFRIRRKKAMSWSIPVYIYEKDKYRHISVDSFTKVEEVVALLAKMEDLEPSLINDYGIFNEKVLLSSPESFDPWEPNPEFIFTCKADPFPTKQEMAAPDFRHKPLEPPQTETTRTLRNPTTSSNTLDKPKIIYPEESATTNIRLPPQPTSPVNTLGIDTAQKTPRSFKSRLLSSFGGLKSLRDDDARKSHEDWDCSDDERETFRRSSITPPQIQAAADKKNPQGQQIEFVSRFYYADMAYTTLKLPISATTTVAISAIMEKLLIKESVEEYAIFVDRTSSDVRNQELYAVHKTLAESEIFLFKRRTKIESHLRPENSGGQYHQSNSSMVEITQDVDDAGDDDDEEEEEEDFSNPRPSLTRAISKSVQCLKGKTDWTQTDEIQELCRVLAYVGKEKDFDSGILKNKVSIPSHDIGCFICVAEDFSYVAQKYAHQEPPKEGWLLVRDEYEEWIDAWVSINQTELKMLLSSLDATTHIIPIAKCTAYLRKGPDIGNMRNTFIIAETGGASYTMACKTFNEMEEWIQKIKSFKGVGKVDDVQESATSQQHDFSPFELCRVLGGKESRQLLLCKQKSTNKAFAVKIASKKTNDKTSLEMESKVLRTVNHPFIIKLHATFESTQQIFFVMDYFAGGELYCQISTFGKFSEERARFYSAEILLGLECLHSHRIVYRHLQLENILMNKDGHVVIADFALSRMESKTDAGLITGPLEYLAPEIIYGQGSSYATDWWAFGIVLYEMLCGSHPFYSADRSQMEHNILQGSIKWPKHLNTNAKGILSSLISRDALQRLGSSSGGEEILQHPFYARIDISKIAAKDIDPPYKPEVVDAYP